MGGALDAAETARPSGSDHSVDVDFADYIGEVTGAIAQADLAHDACVVDEDIERRELAGQRFLECGDRPRIAGIALRHMNVAELGPRRFQLRKIPPGDDDDIIRNKLACEFHPDAAASAGDQNRIAGHFHHSLLRPWKPGPLIRAPLRPNAAQALTDRKKAPKRFILTKKRV